MWCLNGVTLMFLKPTRYKIHIEESKQGIVTNINFYSVLMSHEYPIAFVL